MGAYEDTLKDIETSFGIVPGFMKALPADALVQDWPLMKKYVLGAPALAEIYFLASFSSRWNAMIHAQNYSYATFEEEIHKIGAHLSK